MVYRAEETGSGYHGTAKGRKYLGVSKKNK